MTAARGPVPVPDEEPARAEILARVAWSLVAEPGDATAGAVVAALGAAPALAWARWAVDVPARDALTRLRGMARSSAGRDEGRHADGRRARAGGHEAPTGGPRAPAGGSGGSGAPACGLTAPVQDGLWPDPWPESTARVLARALPRWAPRLDGAEPERAVAVLAGLGGTLLVPGRPGWPRRLDDLGPAAPLCLWVRGDPDLGGATERSAAVVGARAATSYGERVAADLGAGLAERSVAVVSGGAFGIDVAAHRGTLAAGGVTVALLAGGIDRPSPAGNLDVLERLADEGGALVAECPPGTVPSRSRFLHRNRLIAALAGATVVVEAAWRSGALSTAARAVDLLRPVGAVPGPVTSMASAGCHRLLRDGAAVCVTDADEVVELICGDGGVVPGAGTHAARADAAGSPGDPVATQRADRSDSVASAVLDALGPRRGLAVEEVARRAGLAEREVAAELGLLELAGAVRCASGRWLRAPAGDARGR
ncbi:DNA-processing protein DprA [Cellulomonas sp. Marseille-Q8402]